jgi:hypothetical protein
MTAKDLMIDFLNYLFLILLSIFFLFYVVFGNRLEIFKEIMQVLLPFSIFGILFLVVLKVRLSNIKRYKKTDIADEIIVYFTDHDRGKDLLVRFGLPFVMLFLPSLDSRLDAVDIAQALLMFIMNMAWHRLLLRPKSEAGVVACLTRLDRVKDELFIYFLPLVVIAIAALNQHVDTVDILQALSAFAVPLSWHLILFKR